MDMETTASFDAIIEHNASQTAKVLDALSQMTDWMNTVQESIDNINMQLKLAKTPAKEQDADSEPCVTQMELDKSIEVSSKGQISAFKWHLR